MSTRESEQENYGRIIKDDEINVLAIFNSLWGNKRFLIQVLFTFAVIGLVVSLVIPNKYAVNAKLLPSSSEKAGGGLNDLGALAGMAGINLSSLSGGASEIPVDIYPQIVNSFYFKDKLIHQKFKFPEYKEELSIYEYVVADSVDSFSDLLVKYTIKLPWTIKDALKREDQRTEVEFGNVKTKKLIQLSGSEVSAIFKVYELVAVSVDELTGIVSVYSEAESPLLAAQYVQKSIDILQDIIIDYKTKQARENLEFVRERYAEKKKAYEVILKELYDYKDRNRNMIQERESIEFVQLNDNYDMISSVYKSLHQQLEQAQIAVKEETPAFTVIEPVVVPFEKASPKRFLIIFTFIVLGGIIGVSKVFWDSFIKEKVVSAFIEK